MIANIFGKIFAKQNMLRAQAKVTSITRQITKMTKTISRAKTQANQNKRMELNYARQQYSIFGQYNISKSLAADPKFACLFTDGTIDFTKAQANEAAYKEYTQMVQTQTMMAQNALQATLDEIENKYEQYEEIEIQALNDEQADLEAEKVTAEAELELYKGMYEQEKQFAQDNIKGMFA